MSMYNIQKVDKKTALKIIEERKPLGLFYSVEGGTFVAISNEDGNVWCHDFGTYQACEDYLLGKIDSEGNPC